jgi:hypothetical protein
MPDWPGNAGSPLQKVKDPPDRARTYATNPEVCELVRLAHIRDNPRTRFYSQVANHCADTYDVLRKRAAELGTDEFVISQPQIVYELYDGIDSHDDAEKKWSSVHRWLKRLRAAGLIAWEPVSDETGWNVGIRVRLLAVPTSTLPGPAGVAQSVRATSGWRRCRESRQERIERRVRPWDRRSGQKGVGRYELSTPPFFGVQDLTGLELPGDSDPVGGPHPREAVDLHARGGEGGPPAADEVSDAIERNSRQGELLAVVEPSTAVAALPNEPPGSSTAVAAPEASMVAGPEVGGLGVLEGSFERYFGPPRDGRLRHRPTVERLRWVLARLDRYGAFGQGAPWAGVQLADRFMAGHAEEVSAGRAPAPRHLGYFLPALEAEARRWKHQWAPRLKAQRRRRRALQAVATVEKAIADGRLPAPAGREPKRC